MSINTYQYKETFTFENGEEINNLEIAYHTYGRLNADHSNVVWVCHALTANSDVLDWWPGLFGEHDLFNPRDHFIVCANVIGSGYGSTGPLSIDQKTGLPFYLSFPTFTIRDLVKAHQLLADHLEIKQLQVLIGGSLGGQQALEWAVSNTMIIKNLIAIGTNAAHSPWGIAFNESQRLAITTDRTFYANQADGGLKGLKAARSIALLSYRTYDTYGATQLEDSNEKISDYKAASYQNYQGEKFSKRFNAYSYWYLTKAMDSHNLGRGRISIEDTLRKIQCPTLVIAVSTDNLFPTDEQKFIAKYIPKATYFEIESFYGHDGFLIETKILSKGISNFLNKKTITDEAYSSLN
ncbi:homoserine O-acetyltransferase [Sphingobacterium sp. SRCM116780]|uniref:homoserine O-acetyltransferase family protein n=1 Tax=Sphingobacterium sp. SRCM116780 TaxID=2907623 RepID=UPI001F281C87|nr:homoserine O-acetyltransferase [Sphingobacterium sp. SRCM116780]UIR57647.1 homoserine O-acetyltransferase [Sphingobacterium sp. SRCM116780]